MMSIEDKMTTILKRLKSEKECVDLNYNKYSQMKEFKPVLLYSNDSWMVNLEWDSEIVNQDETECLRLIEDDEKSAKTFQEECQLNNIIFTWTSKEISKFYHNWTNRYVWLKEYKYHLSIPLQMYIELMNKIIEEEKRANFSPKLRKTKKDEKRN